MIMALKEEVIITIISSLFCFRWYTLDGGVSWDFFPPWSTSLFEVIFATDGYLHSADRRNPVLWHHVESEHIDWLAQRSSDKSIK